MLEIKKLTKTYKPKKGVPVTALDCVDLKLQDTGMVFILGKSGSGKSTLLNILGGLDTYDSGEIIIKGKSSKDFTQSDFDSYRNTYVGFIFQEYNILEEFTVGANIALAMELQGKKATNEDVERILEEVDLVGYGTRKPNELSGGQMQRVAIARALIKSPEIIMADEPTGALDSKTGIQVFNTLKKLSKTKLVLVVSHDREFAEEYGDRIIEFADGKIISDQKKQIAKKAQTEGVNIIDDSFIYVKKGYRLTPKDLEMINQYIEKTNDDVIISVDGNTNNNIKKMAKIDNEGNREVFRPTDPNSLNITVDDSNRFKLIKSKLPLKDSLKIGASGLKGKPIRLFLTILLSMVSFTLFGLADTMGAYNKVSTSVSSIMDSDIPNLTFIKRNIVKEDNYSYTEEVNLTDEDITKLEDELGIDFKPIYNGRLYPSDYDFIRVSSNYSDGNKLQELYNYYLSSITGFAEFTAEEVNDLGFTIVGEMPSQYNEIAISKYLFEHFQVAGYRNSLINIKPEDIKDENDLIGKELNLDNKIYKITAIIDTNLNTTRYESLKEESENFIDYIIMQEFRTVISNGYHGVAFVKPGFIENMLETNQMKGIFVGNLGNISLENNDQTANYYVGSIAKLSEFDESSIMMFDTHKTSLVSGEVIVSYSLLLQSMKLYEMELPNDIKERYEDEASGYTYSTYGELIDMKALQSLEKYANDHYEEAFEKGFTLEMVGIQIPDNVEISEFEKMNAFLEYLRRPDLGYFNNQFGENGSKIESDTRKAIIIDTNLLSLAPIDFILKSQLRFNKYEEETQSVKVVGVYFSDNQNDMDGYSNNLIVDDQYYKDFEKYKPGLYARAIGVMPTSKEDITKVVNFNYEDGYDDVDYNINNEVFYLLNQVNNFIESSASVFLYIGIGFAVFSSLLLFNFITTSIVHKKREIGVLRALGSRSNDVFGIFYNESLIIALINFILSLIITIGVVIYINSYLRNEYGILITFLNFGIRQIFLMLAVSVLVATISSFLPVFRISRKKPIDAIRNR